MILATRNNDLGHQQTETKLEKLERKIAAVYTPEQYPQGWKKVS